MISHISGKIKKINESSVFLDVNGITYEVTVPKAVIGTLNDITLGDSFKEFIIYHYHQLEPSRAIPVLIGFLNEVEKEFFELFITVSGVGPKAACRALSEPISDIADAIYRGDVKFLKTLPGIGEQRAKEIVAKLQGKVGKFGLLKDKRSTNTNSIKVNDNIKDEAVEVLIQLQYKKKEAQDMIDRAYSRNPEISTCEEILNEVYKQSKI